MENLNEIYSVTNWSLGNFPNYITSTDRDGILASNNGLSEYLDEIIVQHDSLPIAKLLLPDTLLLLNINQQLIFKSARKHKEDGMNGDTIRLQLIESPVSWITLNDTIEPMSVPLNELLAISQGSVTVDSVLQLWTEAVQSSIPPHGKYYIYDHLQNTRVVYHIVCSAPNSTPPFRFELDQVLDYYPFGKILRQFTAPDKGVKYKSTAHERDLETDFDYRIARMYDAEIGRFLSVDPLVDKYPNWNSYNYTLNNPIVYIDPDGTAPKTVKPGSAQALSAIKNTLPQADAAYIKLDANGNINKDLLNLRTMSNSGNFAALKRLVNDDILYEVNVVDKIRYKTETGEIKTANFGDVSYTDYFTGKPLKEPEGWLGVTQTPGDAANKYNSVDGVVRIGINSKLNSDDQARTFSHEGFGHADLYSQGIDHVHKPIMTKNGFVELNKPLAKAIKDRTTETNKYIDHPSTQ